MNWKEITKEDINKLPGYLKTDMLRKRRKWLKKKRKEDKKERDRNRTREKYRKRKKGGKCPLCGKKHEGDTTYCENCLKKQREERKNEKRTKK